MQLLARTWLSLATDPMSGSFQPWPLVKPGFAKRQLALEDRVEAWFGRLLGFHLPIVFERPHRPEVPAS